MQNHQVIVSQTVLKFKCLVFQYGRDPFRFQRMCDQHIHCPALTKKKLKSRTGYSKIKHCPKFKTQFYALDRTYLSITAKNLKILQTLLELTCKIARELSVRLSWNSNVSSSELSV